MSESINQKTAILIQARMGSTRLPGKVLMNLNGKPILTHILDRIHETKLIFPIIIITSATKNDDVIEDFCTKHSVLVFRGDEYDVLDRYYQAAKQNNLEHIIRLTGDNPLVDPENLNNLVTEHIRNDADYSSNKSEVESGLPIGAGAEIFRFSALERSWRDGLKPHHREHVNEYILENTQAFKVLYVTGINCSEECRTMKLTVDTMEDHHYVEKIFQALDKNDMSITLKNICRLRKKGILS